LAGGQEIGISGRLAGRQEVGISGRLAGGQEVGITAGQFGKTSYKKIYTGIKLTGLL
jgi:hypothetical protein